VDILLIVSDTSRRGIQAAVRINDLAKNLSIGVGKTYLIVNQVKEELPGTVLEILDKADLKLAGTIPEDKTIYEYDLNGQPTIEIANDNRAMKAAFEIFDNII
nr:carbon monoxide dehydrogenase [Desulfobacterales bacterium]